MNYLEHEDEKIRTAYKSFLSKEHQMFLKKKEREEMLADLKSKENLEMTRECIDLWKFYKLSNNVNYSILNEIESCIWLNLKDEWGEDSKVSFDYENNTVTCSCKNKHEVI